MMGHSVESLYTEIRHEAESRAYIRSVTILEHSRLVLKARIFITTDLFVQVYRNDHFGTTNFVLIYGNQRLYGRDQLNQTWHRHPVDRPQSHDRSAEGQRAVSFSEFLNEVEIVLANKHLP